MLIEYELQGDTCLHKGIFDTYGFWVKCDADRCDVTGEIQTYKIYSHFSFTYETKDSLKFHQVWKALSLVLEAGSMAAVDGVGYIRELKNQN